MQNLRVLLREEDEALIQLNLVKARIAKEYAKQVKMAQGANKSAKKRKVIVGLAIEEKKVVSNMNSFCREKLFGESAKKKKVADKEKSDKEDEHKDKTLVLA